MQDIHVVVDIPAITTLLEERDWKLDQIIGMLRHILAQQKQGRKFEMAIKEQIQQLVGLESGEHQGIVDLGGRIDANFKEMMNSAEDDPDLAALIQQTQQDTAQLATMAVRAPAPGAAQQTATGTAQPAAGSAQAGPTGPDTATAGTTQSGTGSGGTGG